MYQKKLMLNYVRLSALFLGISICFWIFWNQHKNFKKMYSLFWIFEVPNSPSWSCGFPNSFEIALQTNDWWCCRILITFQPIAWKKSSKVPVLSLKFPLFFGDFGSFPQILGPSGCTHWVRCRLTWRRGVAWFPSFPHAVDAVFGYLVM